MPSGNDNASGYSPSPAIPLKRRGGLTVVAHVVYAIVMREVKTRFGRGNMGYLRALLEPMVFIGGFVLIWFALGRASPIAVPVELFFLCSLFPYVAFTRTWEYSAGAIRSNTGLLMFPIVRPLDFFIARTILEAASQLMVFLILAVAVHGLFGELRHLPADLLGVLLAVLSAITLGAALGLCTGILAMEFPSVEMILMPVRRLLFFSSGVFFIADSLPAILQEYLWWNPVLHATEWFRSAYFSEAESQFLSIEYLWSAIVALLVIGLILERRLMRIGYQ
ncbi:MAG TPA: ABC transporter permease [Alphaproteobacteria bacterium]|nr:ABC transporter permease [Alphaproteobacteria bacterium]